VVFTTLIETYREMCIMNKIRVLKYFKIHLIVAMNIQATLINIIIIIFRTEIN